MIFSLVDGEADIAGNIQFISFSDDLLADNQIRTLVRQRERERLQSILRSQAYLGSNPYITKELLG